MSDFLTRLALRTAGSAGVVRLRPRARFEGAEAAAPSELGGTGLPQRARRPVTPVAEPLAERFASGSPAVVGFVAPPAGAAGAGGPEAAGETVADRDPRAALRPGGLAMGLPTLQPAARPSKDTSDAPWAAREWLAPPGNEPPLPRGSAPHEERAEPDGQERRPDAGPALRAATGRPSVDPAVGPLSAPAPGTDHLIARHVVPALVEAGLLRDPDVTIEREPPIGRSSSRAPARQPIVRVVGEPPRTSSGGDVHVHIDRVVVVQPEPRGAAAPVRARPARASGVDHEAFLAGRRQERL